MVLAEVAGPWTFASLVALLAGVVVVARFVRRPVTLRAGAVEAQLGAIHDTVQGIDRSVNGRPKADPKLYDLAAQTAADVRGLQVDVAALSDHAAATRRLLVDHLAAHQVEADQHATGATG